MTPASMTMRMHINEQIVSPNGRATQTNLPTPILMVCVLTTVVRVGANVSIWW